jgi:hypothetical protein
LVLSAICAIPARPSIALGLLITLYGVEQMLMSQLPFLAAIPAGYNYTVGFASAVAIGMALYRFGAPRVPRGYVAWFAFFFLYTCASALWTDAPITAREWLIHFVAEVPLCVLLPIVTLRQYEDIRLPVQLVVAVSVLVSISLLFNPAQEIQGRTYLVGLATVLSPAEMTGVAFVMLVVLDRETIGVFARVRWPIAALLALALFESGARGQFLLALALPALLFLFTRLSRGLAGAAATVLVGVVGAAVVLLIAMFDTELPRFQKERYSVAALSRGFGERMGFIRESLTLDKPIHGHGVGGWSYMHNHVDSVSKLDPTRITYPHNSVVHVYFELGIVGLIPFLALIAIPIRESFRLLRAHAHDSVLARVVGASLLYFLFSFGLSLKQNTYLAILGFYTSGVMIAVFALQGSRAPSVRPSERSGADWRSGA